ncbi:hypothetical protein Scep_014066 [Stephania cephalantha]|uniref:Uncharacterized protein n=1 Tax=Stephania cephalantha TaxID=152367 RepID=A0AAP0J1V5_9MAGN
MRGSGVLRAPSRASRALLLPPAAVDHHRVATLARHRRDPTLLPRCCRAFADAARCLLPAAAAVAEPPLTLLPASCCRPRLAGAQPSTAEPLVRLSPAADPLLRSRHAASHWSRACHRPLSLAAGSHELRRAIIAGSPLFLTFSLFSLLFLTISLQLCFVNCGDYNLCLLTRNQYGREKWNVFSTSPIILTNSYILSRLFLMEPSLNRDPSLHKLPLLTGTLMFIVLRSSSIPYNADPSNPKPVIVRVKRKSSQMGDVNNGYKLSKKTRLQFSLKKAFQCRKEQF